MGQIDGLQVTTTTTGHTYHSDINNFYL